MGSTRQGLFSTTFAAAIDTLAAVPSAASIAALASIASPTSGDRISQRISTAARRATHANGAVRHVARGAFPLLHPHRGRHALDERQLPTPLHAALRPAIVRTVKNLRIVGSAVLLLNFREVRDFHFCSTSAAM